jgi:hypothetical protein
LDFVRLPLSGACSSPWVELALVDGTIVRVPQQNMAALIAVLRVLRGETIEPWSGEASHA